VLLVGLNSVSAEPAMISLLRGCTSQGVAVTVLPRP